MRVHEGSYDAFLCYSWRNRAVALDLYSALVDHGLRVFRDDTGIEDYDEIDAAIRAALGASRLLVALYTPEFPASPYCQWELYTALTAAYNLDGDTRRVLAVLHGVDFPEVRPRSLTALRLRRPGGATSQTAAAVGRKLRDLDQRGFGDAPEPAEPAWHPFATDPAPRFQGRLPQLWEVHEALVSRDQAAMAGPRIARVVGLGGTGKTMLAEEYARRFARDHPGGVFVLRGFGSHGPAPGRSAALLGERDRQVAGIVQRLGYSTEGRSPAEVDGILRDHLERDGRPYLWLVDDVPTGTPAHTYRAFLAPTAAGHTLLTTRDTAADVGGEVVPVTELDPASAVGLLTSRRPATRQERLVVRDLACKDLGGHAQALDLAAGVSAQPDFPGYAELRRMIAEPGPDALELGAELRGELPGGHAASIAATLLRSIDKLGGEGRTVLRLMSLLGPAPVPQPLLVAALAASGRADRGQAGAIVAAGLLEAARRSLAQPLRPAEPPLWIVHALVSRTVRFTDAGDQRIRLHRALLTVVSSELDGARETMRYRPVANLLPHVPVLAGRTGRELDERHARNEAGRAHVELGQHREAVGAFEDLYQACRATLGEADPITLAALVGLGAAYGLCGRYRSAMETKVQAHAGLAALLGRDHPDTVTALGNIGVSHLELHEPEEARRVLAEVYWARRREGGGYDTEAQVALGNLAVAVGATGRHRLAYRLRRVAHDRLRRVRGPDDPLVLEALNNLGASQRALGDLASARDTYRQCYEARSRVLGESHLETIAALNNLATVDPSGAREKLDRAYRTLVLAGDPGAPLAMTVLHNLLTEHHQTGPHPPGGNRPTASPDGPAPGPPDQPTDPALLPREDFDINTDRRVDLFLRAERAYADLVAAHGPDDPATMRALCWLAHAAALLDQMDHQLQQAAVFIEDAATGLTELLGANHPDALLATGLRQWIEVALTEREQ